LSCLRYPFKAGIPFRYERYDCTLRPLPCKISLAPIKADESSEGAWFTGERIAEVSTERKLGLQENHIRTTPQNQVVSQLANDNSK
jgi:hypothetical protein